MEDTSKSAEPPLILLHERVPTAVAVRIVSRIWSQVPRELKGNALPLAVVANWNVDELKQMT